MRGIHDQLFKEVGIAFPADLVTLTLPHLAKEIDLSTVRFVPGQELFADLLRGRRWYPDLVAEVSGLADPKKQALAHVEIEYAFRSKKLPRLADYNRVLTLGTGLDVHTGVVYLNGGSPGLVEKKYERESFGHVPWTFRYHNLGLKKALGLDYLERPEPLAWAFAVMMNPKGIGSRAQLAMACLHRILEARGLDDERRFKLLNFVWTYVKLDDKVAPEYEALLRNARNQEVRDMAMTWADEIEAKGRQKGIEQGVGKMQNLVLDLMSQRFGRLSQATRRRIAAITSLDELAELAKKIFEVRSPEELPIS